MDACNSSEGISREGRGGTGVVLNVGKCLDWFKVECLHVTIQQKANKAAHPGLLQNTQQGSRVDEIFLSVAGRSVTIPSPHSPGGLTSA